MQLQEPVSTVQLCGISVREPAHLFSQLWRSLSGQTVSGAIAKRRLHEWFGSGGRKAPTVVILDNVDRLWEAAPASSIRRWASQSAARLTVICLTTTSSIHKTWTLLASTTVKLPAYSNTQLQEILASQQLAGGQLAGTALPQDAVQLVADKVACQSGDARLALDICLRATEMTEATGEQEIGLQHVTAVYQEMFPDPKVEAIRLVVLILTQDAIPLFSSGAVAGMSCWCWRRCGPATCAGRR
jgi:Cdc6-like AAA superfamily ATPase